MKFVHLSDCHLGGWRQPELEYLNLKSFQIVIDTCIREKVDFVLIAGDLFDSAYPNIDTLKNTFKEFRRLKDESIPVFLIAGSHDYSVSGKTFLDVLENAGLCKNVSVFEEKEGKIILQPTLYENVAIYGYPGKKSSTEVDEIERAIIQDSPGLFKILMLHTAIKDAVPRLPIKAVDESKLPKVDYLALGHLHIKYSKEGRVYSGPTFPNNLSELEELQGGSFYIFNNGVIKREEIKIKELVILNLKIKNALHATEEILSNLGKFNLKDKIVIIKLSGVLEQGKTSDIDFKKIESYVFKEKAYSFLKSTTKLYIPQSEVRINLLENEDIESQIIKKFEETNPSKYNSFIPSLLKSLQIEKMEDERSIVFEDRILSEVKKILSQ